MMIADPAMKETDPYLETFERFEAQAKQPAWVFPLRKAGIARFAELGFPTLQQEDWRFTNVAPIAKLPFKPVFQVSRDSLTPEAVADVHFWQAGRQPAGVCQRPLRGGTVVARAAAAGRDRQQPGRGAGRRFRTDQGAPGALPARRGQPVCRAQRRLLPGRRLGLCARGQARGGAGASAVHLDGEGGRAPRRIRAT